MNGTVRRPEAIDFQGKTGVLFLLFCVTYAALLGAFSALDLYRSGFDVTGTRVFVYNILRLGFVGYLFWILYASGDLLLAAVSGAGYRGKPALERLALGFFSGAGIWHILLFALGLANLLHRHVVIGLTFTVLVVSWRSFATTYVRDACSGLPPSAAGRGLRPTGTVLVTALVASACLLAMVKGLYPAGGHDYYTHYFHYYREVVESGSIWPNHVWYHFYYSKGAGLFFLAMLLTDPLAPQLVTLCMIAGGAICMAAFMSHLGVTRQWQAAFLTLFFATYVYTPGPHENMLHGGWGDFEKLHEPQTMLVAFLVYALYRLMLPGGEQGTYRISAMLAVAAAVIVTPPTAAFYALAGLLLCGIALVRGMKSNASAIASVLLACLASAAGLLTLNYFVTGFPSDQGMKLFWTFADFEKVQQWDVLPHFVIIHGLLSNLGDSAMPVLSLEALRFLAVCFRLDLFGVAMLLCLLWFAWRIVLRRSAGPDTERLGAAFTVLLCFCVVGCLIALFFGRTQTISFYRFSSFLIPVTVLFAAVLCAYAAPGPVSSNERRLAAATPVVMVLLSALVAASGLYDPRRVSDVVRNAGLFLIGRHSIGSAYAHQMSWPGRLPWGGIYPAARTAHGLVPEGGRLWSLNIHTYCMAPGCRVESYQSYRLGANWGKAFFGTPEQARRSLQAAGLDYFLISTELSIPDPLALSPLLRPPGIAAAFGV